MEISEVLPVFINIGLLSITLLVAVIILRASSVYSYNFGDDEVQLRMRWIILKGLLALLVLGTIAAVYNLFFV